MCFKKKFERSERESQSSDSKCLVTPGLKLWPLTLGWAADFHMCKDIRDVTEDRVDRESEMSPRSTYLIHTSSYPWVKALICLCRDFRLQYLTQSPSRIGRRYKKAVYTLYSNESFTERVEDKQRKAELGILGPVIRAQIRDVITVRSHTCLRRKVCVCAVWLLHCSTVCECKHWLVCTLISGITDKWLQSLLCVLTRPPVLSQIVFKNMASRPYSIYPHGLTIEKLDEGVNYPEGGTNGVQHLSYCTVHTGVIIWSGTYHIWRFARKPVSCRAARWDTHLHLEGAGRGSAFRWRFSMSDTDVPQCSGHTERHRLRADWTDPHLQGPVPQRQKRAGKVRAASPVSMLAPWFISLFVAWLYEMETCQDIWWVFVTLAASSGLIFEANSRDSQQPQLCLVGNLK